MITLPSSLPRAARSLGLLSVGVLSTLGALSLAHVGPAQAQSPGVNLAQLAAQVSSLQAQVAVLQAKTAPITTTGSAAQGYLVTFTRANVQIVNGLNSSDTQNGLGNLIVGYNESRAGSPYGPDARTGSHNIITGVLNNFTESGGILGGYGNSLSGFGEFAVGALNTVRGNQSAVSGGIRNTATGDYASVSGGDTNTASGTSASISGGAGNTVSTQYGYAPVIAGPQGPQGIPGPKGDKGDVGAQGPAGAGFTPDKIAVLNAFTLSSDPSAGGTNTLLTISGVNVQIVNGMGGTETVNGLGNLIVGYDEKDSHFTQARTGSHNLVVGMGNNYLSYGGLVAGQDNDISGPFATVTGGQLNIARSGHASVSGGNGNTASGGSSSVSGGQNNIASGDYASISGGARNTASGGSSSISGGFNNTATGKNQAGLIDASSVSGGSGNVASGGSSSVSGGENNTAIGGLSSVSGGNGLTENTPGGWKAGSQSGVPFPTEGNFASD